MDIIILLRQLISRAMKQARMEIVGIISSFHTCIFLVLLLVLNFKIVESESPPPKKKHAFVKMLCKKKKGFKLNSHKALLAPEIFD